MFCRFAKAAMVLIILTASAELCQAQYSTTTSRGTPAGTPQLTPYTYTVTGAMETDLLRVRIRKIDSFGMGGYVFNAAFGTVYVLLNPKYITAGGMQMYVAHERLDNSLVTGSGNYHIDFEKQNPTLSVIGTVDIVP